MNIVYGNVNQLVVCDKVKIVAASSVFVKGAERLAAKFFVGDALLLHDFFVCSVVGRGDALAARRRSLICVQFNHSFRLVFPD